MAGVEGRKGEKVRELKREERKKSGGYIHLLSSFCVARELLVSFFLVPFENAVIFP